MNAIERKAVSLLRALGILVVAGYMAFFAAPMLLVSGIMLGTSGALLEGSLLALLGFYGYRVYWICVLQKHVFTCFDKGKREDS